MAIKINEIKCPNCDAVLSIDDNMQKIFCRYCGTLIMISNENEYIYRHIDEAGLKQAETDQIVRIKELEYKYEAEKQSIAFKEKLIKTWLIASAVAILLTILLFILNSLAAALLIYLDLFIIGGGAYYIFTYYPKKEEEKMLIRRGAVKFPNLGAVFDESYECIKNQLAHAGYTNIECINMHDLVLGFFKNQEKLKRLLSMVVQVFQKESILCQTFR